MSASSPPPAMVLAAGRGKRLGKIGDNIPKALVEVGGEPMICRIVRALARAGIREIVVNLHHLGEMIEAELRDLPDLGVSIAYSRESTLLDVAGGIANALPLLGDRPFVVANSDIFSDLDYRDTVAAANSLGDDLACLFLGDNPDFRPDGDFSLVDGRIRKLAGDGLTYMGCAAYRPEFFGRVTQGQAAAIMPIWLDAIDRDLIAGRRHKGSWVDVGTPERIERAKEGF